MPLLVPGTFLELALGFGYVLLLWVATSIAPGKGVLPFVVGLIAYAWAERRAAKGVTRFRSWLILLVAAFALPVLALEGILAVFPGLLRGPLANYVFGGYHAGRGGIYAVDPRRGHRMKPSFRRRLFWNGHWWTHETNSSGYRGPSLPDADAAFLGDSMVYGHGLDLPDTVPSRFGSLSGLSTANLGQPGIGAIEALALYEDIGSRLRPEPCSSSFTQTMLTTLCIHLRLTPLRISCVTLAPCRLCAVSFEAKHPVTSSTGGRQT